MDNRRFDAFTKTLTTSDSPRRTILQVLGASALAAVVGRFAGDDAEAKKKRKNKNKKKKKCKGNTRKCNGKCIPQDNCCVDGDCDPGQLCQNGACVIDANPDPDPECQNNDNCDAGEVCRNGVCVDANLQECQSADNCAANEICFKGTCRCAPPNKPCGDACCPENQVCLDGQCVTGQGTCPAGDSICNNDSEDACNGDNTCFCVQRNDTEEARCIGGFLNDSRDNCTCIDDGDCERDFPGQGAICIQGGPGCQCTLEIQGRCARLCPTQVGS